MFSLQTKPAIANRKASNSISDFTIYCNPYPIVDRHVTIVHREHTPQQIAGQLGALLDLAKALPGYFVIYNGPECGASAPDHLHFQAGLRTLFPIEVDPKTRSVRRFPTMRAMFFSFAAADRSPACANKWKTRSVCCPR